MPSAALLILRLMAGLGLASHGYQKIIVGGFDGMEAFGGWLESIGFPAPLVFAWAAKLTELVGGTLVALGLWTRPAAFFAACTMVVAILVAHLGEPFPEWELAALYLSSMVAILLAGPGPWSIDHRRTQGQ